MSSSPHIEPAFLDFRGMEARYSIAVRTLRDYARRPDFPASYRLPGKTLFKIAEIDHWLEKFRQEPGQGLAGLVDACMEKVTGGGG